MLVRLFWISPSSSFTKFFYGDIRQHCPEVRLIYTDTDILTLFIEMEDSCKEMSLDNYDTSNYPKARTYFSKKNKNVIGLPKDEVGGKSLQP